MPDHNKLSNTRKKPSKSFREYAIKWREQVARVNPLLNDQELVDIFIETRDLDYLHHLTAPLGRSFHITKKMGKWSRVVSKREGS